MGDRRDWRGFLAALLRSVNQVWNLKAWVALGATDRIGPHSRRAPLNGTGQRRGHGPRLGDSSEGKGQARIGSMFVLKKASGSDAKAFAEHGSHRFHRSHRSGAWVR